MNRITKYESIIRNTIVHYSGVKKIMPDAIEAILSAAAREENQIDKALENKELTDVLMKENLVHILDTAVSLAREKSVGYINGNIMAEAIRFNCKKKRWPWCPDD